MTASYSSLFMKALANNGELPWSEMKYLLMQREWNSLWQLREHLLRRAETAGERSGYSYRDFKVGAAAFVTSTQPELLRSLGRTPDVVLTGANWKAGRDERNTCAEQEIVAQLRQQKHLLHPKKVLALFIFGKRQDEPDGESGILTATLHPCRHCRRLLQAVPEIKRDTVIVTTTPDGVMEIMRFDELLHLHGNRNTKP